MISLNATLEDVRIAIRLFQYDHLSWFLGAFADRARTFPKVALGGLRE